ncbi:hypothetical protein N9C31_02395, partial [Gammaproteobacteria bacterium]|nr:hypothetical protein [Gammaproteobacteria bacterium]
DTQNNFTEQLKAGIFNFNIFPQLNQGSDEDVPRAAIRTIMDYKHQMFKKLTDNEQIIFIATMITKLHELYSPKEMGEYRSSLIDQNVKFYFQHIQIRDFDKLSQILGSYSNTHPDATFSIAMNVLIPIFSCLYIQDESKTEDRQGVFNRIGISHEVLADRTVQLRTVIEPFHEKFDCKESDDCNPVLAKFANMAIDLKSGNANQYNLLLAKMTLVESTPEGDFYLYQLGINQYRNNQSISAVISKALLQEGGKQANMILDFTRASSGISDQVEAVANFVQLMSSEQSSNRQEGEQNAALLSQAKAADEAAKRQADAAKRQADAANKELAKAAAKALAKEEPVGEISAASLDARGAKSEKQVIGTTLEEKKKQLVEKIRAQAAAKAAAAEAKAQAAAKAPDEAESSASPKF